MTPAEFAPEVATAYPESADGFDALTRAYEDVRYGSAHLDDPTLRELNAHRRSILAALRRRAPSPDPRRGPRRARPRRVSNSGSHRSPSASATIWFALIAP